MDDTRVAEQLGGLQSDVRAVLRGLDALGARLDRHFEDDAKLAGRVGAVEIEQARVAGRSAALASIAGIIAGIGGGWLSRTLLGGH